MNTRKVRFLPTWNQEHREEINKRNRSRYRNDAEFRERRKKQARERHAKHRPLLCSRCVAKLKAYEERMGA